MINESFRKYIKEADKRFSMDIPKFEHLISDKFRFAN